MRTRVIVIVLGLAVVAGASVLGAWLGERVEQRASPSPVSDESPQPSPGERPLPSPEASPTPAAATSQPTPTPVSPPQPARSSMRLTLESLPAVVRRNTPVLVRWRIEGPAGASGSSTRVTVVLNGVVQDSGDATSGAFLLPARFESVVRAGAPGELEITVEATADGQMLRTRQRIRVH